MARSALPQDYITSPGTLVEDFGDASEWVTTADGVASNDTTNFIHGDQSVKLTIVNAGGTCAATKAVNLDLTGVRTITLCVYLPPSIPIADVGGITMYLTSSAVSFSKYFHQSLNKGGFKPGWNVVTMSTRLFVNVGADTWGVMRQMRFTLFDTKTKSPNLSFDYMLVDREYMPRCLLCFDDGFTSQYLLYADYMDDYHIRGTINVISSAVGKGSYANLEQLTEMHEAGWTVANHCTHHTDLSTQTYAQQLALIQGCDTYLETNGFFENRNRHMCYPYNSYDANTLLILADLGYVTGQTSGSARHFRPYPDLYQLPRYAPGAGATFATVSAWVDGTILDGGTIIYYFHDIESYTGWGHENINALIDYLYYKRSAIQCLTIDEWYKGLTNPRYQSLPVGRT